MKKAPYPFTWADPTRSPSGPFFSAGRNTPVTAGPEAAERAGPWCTRRPGARFSIPAFRFSWSAGNLTRWKTPSFSLCFACFRRRPLLTTAPPGCSPFATAPRSSLATCPAMGPRWKANTRGRAMIGCFWTRRPILPRRNSEAWRPAFGARTPYPSGFTSPAIPGAWATPG